MSLRLVGCQLLLIDGQLAASESCCCTPPCTGPCDEETPCPEGCVCVEGECISVECVSCHGPSQWRIVDGDGNVFASGDFILGLAGLYCVTGSPLTPTHYWTTGTQEWKLEVYGCTEAWAVLDSWEWTITLCEGVSERYPQYTLDESWPPPEGCDCAYLNSTQEIIDPCVPCPDLVQDSTFVCGVPPTGPASLFTGLIDGEWTNLLNWEDADGQSPAGLLPTSADDVTIEGSVTSVSSDYSAVAGNMVIQSAGSIHIPVAVETLECYGIVGTESDCDAMIGHITASGSSEFLGDDARLDGEVTASLTVFLGGDSQGVVNGNAEFNDNTENAGTVFGDATFISGTNTGTVDGNAAFSNFGQNSGVVTGNATFDDDSFNTFGIVEGDATFNDDTRNTVFGTVNGHATFNGSSANLGLAGGNATFNGNANNYGTVSGTATFNDSAVNCGGTAGTFVPDPPPSC